MSSNAQEAFVHINIAAVRDRGNCDGFGVRVKCLTKSLLYFQPLRQLLLLDPLLLKLLDFSYIFDAVNNVGNFIVRPQDGRVHRAPMPFLKSASLSLRFTDVILLDRHRVWDFPTQYSPQG